MKYLFPILFAFAIIISLTYLGCSPTSSDSSVAKLKGIVKDTSLPGQPRVSGATVYLDQVDLTTSTNDSGYFEFSDLPGGGYNMSVTKPGYVSYTEMISILADDTNIWVTVPLIFKKIYFANDLVLDINNSARLNNPIGNVPNSSPEKDIVIADTLIGTDILAYIRSGDMDIVTPGFQTWFSGVQCEGYTQSQFDTLSAYRTEDGLMMPETRDFPNHEGIDRFIDVNNYQHAVWFFYLRGRGVGSSAIYGALYLDSAWYDSGSNTRKIRVDIKINASGKYIFDLNLKK